MSRISINQLVNYVYADSQSDKTEEFCDKLLSNRDCKEDDLIEKIMELKQPARKIFYVSKGISEGVISDNKKLLTDSEYNDVSEGFRKILNSSDINLKLMTSGNGAIYPREKSDHSHLDKQTYVANSLKFLNCLTEFYYSERLFPNIQSNNEESTATKLDNLNSQDISTASEEQVEAMDHLQMWQAGFLKCDLDR